MLPTTPAANGGGVCALWRSIPAQCTPSPAASQRAGRGPARAARTIWRMDSAPPQTSIPTSTSTPIPAAPLIFWLDAPQGADDPQPPAPALLGGKGASLVRLVRAGLPVPPGFVILPAAFAAPAG